MCKKTCVNAPGGPKVGTYYRISIAGDLLEDVPLLLKYKIPTKAKDKHYERSMITSFKITKLNIGDYCGFETDGNKRFLLGDFTVTHNSSLMKSIGLSVVMAQCGMFVPATSFEFSPYESIMARITGSDNIFKGLSSFALEMTELRAILKRTGPKTLVIGDEVCRGTEHISGNAIVAASIIKLAKTGSSFIFATHLHEIAEMDKIKELSNVKAFHLTVDYDKEKDILIFDRKLKEGPGDTVYGITVARYIIHDNEFIRLAQEIKNELLKKPNVILNDKKSTYNSEIFMHECSICHKSCTDKNKLDSHHINFQSDCIDGFVISKPYVPMNSKSNISVLCEDCHNKVHNNSLEIKGYLDTSNGRQLIYKEILKPKEKPKRVTRVKK